MAGCGDVLSLEDLQTAKKHQVFEAEVITGKAGGVAGGANIGTATNPVTGQTQQTLPSILADLGFDVQSWTSSTGGVLASANQVFLNDNPGSLGLGDYYAWGGTFPKTVPAGTDPALPTSGYIMRSSRFAGTQAREALRRSYAEAGYNLVDGSFEAGGTLVNVNDVLLQERTGKAFSGPAGVVAAGTNPTSGGFVDRSAVVLRDVSVTMFASSATVTTAEFIAAVALANAAGLKLVSPRNARVVLTGNTNIDIQTSVDMSGAVIDVSSYGGRLTFLRKKTKTDNGVGSAVLTALQAETELYGTNFTGWNGVADVADSYVIIETSEPHYRYRGNVVNRFELNKHTRYGVMASALTSPIQTSTLSNIQVFPMEDAVCVAENITFYLGRNEVAQENIRIESSRFRGRRWLFLMDYDFANAVTNPTIFNVVRSCDVQLNDIVFKWTNRSTATTGYTYNFSMDMSYDITIDGMKAQGDGWGATGNNSCARVTIRNSDISRVDFHQPFREYLRLQNCEIGQWGVLCSAIGDLEITGGSMTVDTMTYTNNLGFVRSRDDTGGFCDGDLTFTGVKLINTTGSQMYIARHQWSSGNPVPSGSVIQQRFWRNIIYDNVKVFGSVNALPLVVANSGVRYPSSVSLVNTPTGDIDMIEGGYQFITPDSPLQYPGASNAAVSDPNLVINITKSAVRYLKLREIGTQKFSVDMNVNGLLARAASPFSTVTALCVGGIMRFSDSRIDAFNFNFASTANDKKLDVYFNSGTIRHRNVESGVLTNGFNSNINLVVSDSHVNADNTARLMTMLPARMSNVTFSVGSFAANDLDVTDDFALNATQSVNVNLSTKTDYYLICGYTANNTDRYLRVVLPDPGKSTFVQITAATSVTLTRSADGSTITAANSGSGLEFARRIVVR